MIMVARLVGHRLEADGKVYQTRVAGLLFLAVDF